MGEPKRDATDEVISRYLSRMPGAQEANALNAEYHAQIALLRRLLTVADLVMEDEGVPESVRLRVLRTVMYGSPDEGAAERQQVDRAKLVAAMETNTFIVPPRWP